MVRFTSKAGEWSDFHSFDLPFSGHGLPRFRWRWVLLDRGFKAQWVVSANLAGIGAGELGQSDEFLGIFDRDFSSYGQIRST